MIFARTSTGSSPELNIRQIILAQSPVPLCFAEVIVQAVLPGNANTFACAFSETNPAVISASPISRILDDCRAFSSRSVSTCSISSARCEIGGSGPSFATVCGKQLPLASVRYEYAATFTHDSAFRTMPKVCGSLRKSEICKSDARNRQERRKKPARKMCAGARYNCVKYRLLQYMSSRRQTTARPYKTANL